MASCTALQMYSLSGTTCKYSFNSPLFSTILLSSTISDVLFRKETLSSFSSVGKSSHPVGLSRGWHLRVWVFNILLSASPSHSRLEVPGAANSWAFWGCFLVFSVLISIGILYFLYQSLLSLWFLASKIQLLMCPLLSLYPCEFIKFLKKSSSVILMGFQEGVKVDECV